MNLELFGLVFLCYYIFPFTHSFAVAMIKSWIDARYLLGEFFDPYFSRCQTLAQKHINQGSRKQKKQTVLSFSTVFQQHESFLLGFYLPFGLALGYLPNYISPLIWFIGYGVCGQGVVDILHKNGD